MYEEVSGQAINLNKLGMLFSLNVQDELKRNLFELLGVSTESGQGAYLGLPSLVEKSKRAIFGFLTNRV